MVDTIVARNQTGSPVPLYEIGVVIPASGEAVLTDYAPFYQILCDPELGAAVDGGSVLLTIDGVDLDAEGSSVAANGPPVQGVLAHSDLADVGLDDRHQTIAQKAALDANIALSGENPVVDQASLDAAIEGITWELPVISASVLEPPESPEVEDRYLILGTGSGDWVGHDGEIVEWSGSVWEFTAPADGTVVPVQDEDIEYRQVAPEAPWKWAPRPGGTAVHGNNKHSPNMLTVGGNRTDANLNALTGGGETGLHTHPPTLPSGAKIVSSVDMPVGSSLLVVPINPVYPTPWRTAVRCCIDPSLYGIPGFTAVYNFVVAAHLSTAGVVELRLFDVTHRVVVGDVLSSSGAGVGYVTLADSDRPISDFQVGRAIIDLQVRQLAAGRYTVHSGHIEFVREKT